MNGSRENEQNLQKELIFKENIVLAQYVGLLGFSAACLVSVLSAGAFGFYAAASFCLFIISTFSFAAVVLSRLFVLHKGASVHIAHVIVAENTSEPAYIIGGISIVFGLAIFSMQFSPWCAPFVLICAALAFRYHVKFKKKFDAL